MKDWIPLFQTLSWVGLIVYGAKTFRSHLDSVFSAIYSRIKTGSSFKAGPIEIGEDLKSLEKIAPSSATAPPQDSWIKERETIYKDNQGLFLAHIIEPSQKNGQLFDIFIFLVRHKSEVWNDVESAEFFLGHYWGNQVFRETKKNGLIGIRTSAYGPFLCTCRIKMKDGKEIRLNRYIDFEMGRIFKNNG